jgi:hypothetical protein
METELRVLEREGEPQKGPVHWSESEWFQVWLRLARRDYQGRPDLQKDSRRDSAPLAA